MNENLAKIIAESLVEASKMGTVNALTYIQKGLEAYKMVEIPIVSSIQIDGKYCCGSRIPYLEDKQVQTFVDFMLVYLDEAIKSLDKGKSEENE